MRLRRRYVPLVAVLGAVVAVLPSVASSETPAVEAVNAGIYSHYWSPSQVIALAGSAVTFRNPTTVEHGLEWVAGPAKPECSSGVPVGTTVAAAGKEWSGTCTFVQAGTYTFYCTVHGPEMTGRVTVNADGTTTTTTTTPTSTATTPTTSTPTAPVEAPGGGSPLVGTPSLRSKQRGGSVSGSLEISNPGAGARLKIELFARGTALGRTRHVKRVRVGALVRRSVSAGRASFVVKLDAKGRRALARDRRLVLEVRITLTPAHGPPLTVIRAVVEHA